MSARQTLSCLGPHHDVEIVDPSALCICRFSRFVRAWHRCPSAARAPLTYLRFVLERIREKPYDVLLPTHEQVYLFAKFAAVFARHVHLAVPSFSAIDRTQTKPDFIRLLRELKLPHPHTELVRCETELRLPREYPCFLKLAQGTAGTGVRKVASEAALISAYQSFREGGLVDAESEFLIQQPGVGRQCTVQLVFQLGELVAAHCFESIVVGHGGASTVRQSVAHPIVIEQMRQLGRHLQWHGALFVEYFYQHDRTQPLSGEPQYMEANPRIGEPVNALLAGINLPETLVRVSMGEPVGPVLASQVGIRTHSGFLALMEDALAGATRRQLFNRLQEIRRREGPFADSQDELTRRAEDWPSCLPAAKVAAQLFINPRSAHSLFTGTVENYSIPESAIRQVRDLDELYPFDATVLAGS